jgi:hypothetical protein
MGWPVLRNRALSRYKALREHLPAKYAAVWHPLGWAGKNVFSRSCATGIS